MQNFKFINYFFLILFTVSCTGISISESKDTPEMSPADKLKEGEEEYKKGYYVTAIKIFNEVIRENDAATIYPAYYDKAYCYYKLNEYDNARNAIKFVLTIPQADSNYAWFSYNSHFMLGRMASKEDHSEAAVDCYEEAIKYMQTHNIYNTIAYCEADIGRYESALEHANLAIEYDTTSTSAYALRSFLHLKTNQIKEAKEDVEKAISLDSLNPFAYKFRALISIELNKMGKVCEDLYKANELGYKKYSNARDSTEVDSLINRYCGPTR